MTNAPPERSFRAGSVGWPLRCDVGRTAPGRPSVTLLAAALSVPLIDGPAANLSIGAHLGLPG